ncbi:jg22236 [Pararge aegeria aegeria]|uniref:Jg22236 protein n=1 Tax=Pararge aegeria aegeria TaxID=348720 RepID=A0A8S4QPI0_9NEOP|nr:jg22236 [Pararge aegeria aegeria]
MSHLPQSRALWDYFSKLAGDDKIANCNECSKDLSYRTSVTNLKTHLKLRHNDLYKRYISECKAASRRSVNDLNAINDSRRISNFKKMIHLTWTDNSNNVKKQASQEQDQDTHSDPLLDDETGDTLMGPGTDISEAETLNLSPEHFSDRDTLPSPEPRATSPPDSKPAPRRTFASTLPRRRRRFPVRNDGLIAKRFLDIEEEKLRVSKERNNAINRVADMLKQISNKLDEFI